MRLLLRVRPLKNYVQNEQTTARYHVGMRGWIYSKMKDTNYNWVHDAKAFKPFSFSSVMGVKDALLEKGKEYTILISSPLPDLIEFLRLNSPEGELMNIGEYQFKIMAVKKIEESLRRFDIIRSATLISVTKRVENKYVTINFLKNKEEFLNLLAINLIRKYNSGTDSEISEDYGLFERCLIEPLRNKLISVKINANDKQFTVMGNSLLFKLGNLSRTQLNIFNYCFDMGFGVKNSYGFGFMIKNKINKLEYLDDFNSLI